MSTIRIGRGVEVPESELHLRAARSGGPGGQSVNTTSSKVELRWNVRESPAITEAQRRRVLDRLSSRITADGELILTGSEHRTQLRNRHAVIARFQAIVGEALKPPKARRATRPTRASRQRRREAKQRRSEKKRLRRPPQT